MDITPVEETAHAMKELVEYHIDSVCAQDGLPRGGSFRLREEEGRSPAARSTRLHRHQGCQEARGLVSSQPITRHCSGAAELGN